MDKKGIFAYLVLTFGAFYAVTAVVYWAGASSAAGYLTWLLVVVPAGAAWLAARLSSASVDPGTIRGIPKLAALRAALLIPVIFAAAYLMMTVIGQGKPDWRMGSMLAQLPSARELQLSGPIAALLPTVYLVMGFVVSAILGPTVFALFVLANEYGWRGYLLPRLMPLGRPLAYVLSGLALGLAYAPLFAVTSYTASGWMWVLVPAMAIVVSAVLGEVWRRSRHLGLVCVFAGCILCQATTIWPYLFPEGASVRYPWGGRLGVVMILVWGIVALTPGFFFGRLESTAKSGSTTLTEPVPEAAQP